MTKIFEFAGKQVVAAHIVCYWIEAADVVFIMFGGGSTLKHETHSEEDARNIIKNIEDAILTNLHQ